MGSISDMQVLEVLLVRVPAAARLLNISSKTVYRWLDQGIIPEHVLLRVGSRIYFRAESLRAWAANGVTPARAK